jgi:hypothetical protein
MSKAGQTIHHQESTNLDSELAMRNAEYYENFKIGTTFAF